MFNEWHETILSTRSPLEMPLRLLQHVKRRYRNARCGTGLKADFYDTKDDQTVAARLEILAAAVEDMITYLLRAGEVAILDGTNFTK